MRIIWILSKLEISIQISCVLNFWSLLISQQTLMLTMQGFLFGLMNREFRVKLTDNNKILFWVIFLGKTLSGIIPSTFLDLVNGKNAESWILFLETQSSKVCWCFLVNFYSVLFYKFSYWCENIYRFSIVAKSLTALHLRYLELAALKPNLPNGCYHFWLPFTCAE